MSACFPWPLSLQSGVRESSDFDSRLAAFRPEEEERVILQVAIIVAKQRSVAISEIKWSPFNTHLLSAGTVENSACD